MKARSPNDGAAELQRAIRWSKARPEGNGAGYQEIASRLRDTIRTVDGLDRQGSGPDANGAATLAAALWAHGRVRRACLIPRRQPWWRRLLGLDEVRKPVTVRLCETDGDYDTPALRISEEVAQAAGLRHGDEIELADDTGGSGPPPRAEIVSTRGWGDLVLLCHWWVREGGTNGGTERRHRTQRRQLLKR